MADILASVSVVLGAEVSGFKAAMAEARKDLKGLVQFSEGLQSIGNNLTRSVTAPLGALGAIAVVSSARLESLKNGLQAIAQQELGAKGITGLGAVSEAARQTGQRLNELLVIAKAPGLGFEGAEAADIRLRAVGISAEQSAKSIKAFANAIATTGGGGDEFNRVTVQLAQLSAKGKVLAQDLRPIIEAAPAVASALQRLYGTVDSETISASLAKQGQSSKDFIRVLTTELAKLPQVTGGLKAIYENDMDALLVASAKVGDGIAKAFNLQGLGDSIGEQITALGDGFARLSAPTQQLIVVLAGAAAATGPVLVGLGTLGVALPAVKAGFLAVSSAVELLSTGLVALANPATLAVVGLAALAGGVYYLATANERAYDSFLKQAAATQKLTAEVSPLLDRYDELRAKTTLTASEQLELKAIIEKVTAAMPAAGQGLDHYGNYLGLATTKARELIVANQGLEKAIALKSLPAQQQKLADLEKQYANLIRIRDGFNQTGQFKYSADDKTGYAPGTKELIEFRSQLEQTNGAVVAQQKVVAALGGAVNGTTNDYKLFNEAYKAYQERFYAANSGISSQIQILATLKARLKEVQEQRDKETTVGAIKVDNTEILHLQQKIAALEGLDKASKKTADAIAKLRQELARLTALDNLLGDTPSGLQVLERRADTLVKGLKTLVDAGVSPASKAFQAFEQDLVRTSQAADRLLAGLGKGADVNLLNFKPVDIKSLIPQTIGDTLAPDVARLLGDFAKQPLELPLHLEIKPIIGTGVVGSLQDGLLAAVKGIDVTGLGAPLLQYGKDLRSIGDLTKVFGSTMSAAFAGFDTGAAQVNAARAALQDLLASGFGPLSPVVQAAAENVRNFTIASENTRILTAGLQSGFEALGTSIGEALIGSGDVMEAAGQALLRALASIGEKYGSFLIALGIADVATGFASIKGAAEIAAGVGLIGASAALGAIGGGGSRAASSVGSSGISTPKVTNYGQNSNQTTVKVLAEFKLRGKDFVAFGQQKDYRAKVTG